jgi:hypothetical protein
VSDAPEIIDAAGIFQRFPDTWDTIYQYIKKLEQENDALNEAVESLRTTLWGMEFELEKTRKEIDALRKDKERLDWLLCEDTKEFVTPLGRGKRITDAYLRGPAESYRAAIDAARAEKGGVT